MAGGELTEPGDWQFQPLEELDQLLRCPICFEYYEATMMFPQCSHNFCSLCIRRYMSAGHSKCPLCAVSVTEGDLRNNRLLDQLIQHFKNNRQAFLRLVQNGTTQPKDDSTEEKGREKERDGCHGKRRLYSVPDVPDLPDSETFIDDIMTTSVGATTAADKREVEGEGEMEDDESAEITQSPSFLSPWQPGSVREGERGQLFGDLGDVGSEHMSEKKRGKGRIRSSSTPSRSHSSAGPSNSSPLPPPSSPLLSTHSPSLNHTHINSSITSSSTPVNSPSSDKVECPICGQSVLARFINRHLDTVCLKKPETPNSQSQRKYAKIPRLVYQIMKDRQLKVKLKEYHLPTHGDRQTLIGRLKEFILRFNAQCDSLNPRPAKEVAMEIEQEERMRHAGKQTQPSPATRSKKEATAEEIEKEKKDYEERHKDQFSRLISQARDQMKEERSSEKKDEEVVVGGSREKGWGERGEGGTHQDSEHSDTTAEDGLVLAEASPPDPDLTPPLAGASDSGFSLNVPESPPHGIGRKRKREDTTPSPPPPPLTSREGEGGGEDSDEEFVPHPAHYRTPSTSVRCTRASKRPHR